MRRSFLMQRAVWIGLVLGDFAGCWMACATARTESSEIAVTGRAGPGLERLDEVVTGAMRRHEIPGASLAVARNGALVLARGYGWADRDARIPARPETLFALASVSKSLTAVTVLELADAGQVGLDAPVFTILRDLEPLPGDTPDPRIGRITVRHLLYHAGGWDRARSGDPNGFSDRVARRMGVPLPIAPRQLARFMLGRPLDFDPGTECRYSNFGYILLGLVIEKVTGESYEAAVHRLTIRPMGLGRIRLDRVRGGGYLPLEAHRYGPNGHEDRQGGHLPITMAPGGWLATPTEMVRFLAVVDGSRGAGFRWYRQMLAPPPPPAPARPDGGHFGMGWDRVTETPRGFAFRKNGGLLGVHSWLEHRDDGVDWALFWNGGRVEDDEGGPVPRRFVAGVDRALTGIRTWPEVDLFDDREARPARAGDRR